MLARPVHGLTPIREVQGDSSHTQVHG